MKVLLTTKRFTTHHFEGTPTAIQNRDRELKAFHAANQGVGMFKIYKKVYFEGNLCYTFIQQAIGLKKEEPLWDQTPDGRKIATNMCKSNQLTLALA